MVGNGEQTERLHLYIYYKTVEGRKSKKTKNYIYAFIFKLYGAENVPQYSTSVYLDDRM